MAAQSSAKTQGRENTKRRFFFAPLRLCAVALGPLAFLLIGVPVCAETELRGRVMCLPEEMHLVHKTDLPARHEHIYGFRAGDGTYYTLLRTKLSEALFVDERLRAKDLVLKGNVLPKTQILEVVSIKSIRNGVVHDLYYYCEICAIESVAPEECACCQGPVELVERPLSTPK